MAMVPTQKYLRLFIFWNIPEVNSPMVQTLTMCVNVNKEAGGGDQSYAHLVHKAGFKVG